MAAIIQGKSVDSINEQNVAAALDQLKREYIYQYPIGGGNRVRGGFVLDFLITDTAPQQTAVNIQGSYWHKATQAEAFETALIDDWCKKHNAQYIQLTEAETADATAAKKALREKAGL